MKFKYILLSITLSTATPLLAQDIKVDSVELEKAVFLQETKKDYAAAAKIYSKVLENSNQANLETTYRLSQCLKQLGQQKEYHDTLDKLSNYEDPKNKWVKLALEEKKSALKLNDPIWEDGDALSYNIILPDGSKKIYYTLIYDQLPKQQAWKMSTLRCHFDDSRSEIIFDANNYRPLSSYWIFINSGTGYHTKYDHSKTWSHNSFDNDFITSLIRVLPADNIKRNYEISVAGNTTPALIYRTTDTKKITTPAGEFECSKIMCEFGMGGQIKIEAWVNTKGKKELIELTQPGLNIQLASIAKRKDLQALSTKINAFPFTHTSKSNLHQIIANNKDVYRTMIFPSKEISLARLEINHTKNLLEPLRKDPVALATYLENNIRKQKGIAKFKLPKNTEHLTLAGCKGILYTDKTRAHDGDGTDQFICFYGINENYSIFLQGSCAIGQEKAAREELKRILTEDLKVKK